MALSTAPLCCLILLGVVYLTTASPAPFGYDRGTLEQAVVAAKLYNQPVDDVMQATIQQHCCSCGPCRRYATISSIIPIDRIYCPAVVCYSCDWCDWHLIPY